jgi:hypothetical protein
MEFADKLGTNSEPDSFSKPYLSPVSGKTISAGGKGGNQQQYKESVKGVMAVSVYNILIRKVFKRAKHVERVQVVRQICQFVDGKCSELDVGIEKRTFVL